MRKGHREQPQIVRRDIVSSAIRIRKRRVQIRQLWGNIFLRCIMFVLLVWIVFTFLLGIETVRTNDMFPSVREGDLAIYIRIPEYRNADVVLYRDTIGRIQGTPGMKIDRTGGDQLTIEGNLQPIQKRSGLYYPTETKKTDRIRYPSSVPEGEYLVLGDQREDARDSRAIGYVPREELKGKVFMVIRRRAL